MTIPSNTKMTGIKGKSLRPLFRPKTLITSFVWSDLVCTQIKLVPKNSPAMKLMEKMSLEGLFVLV